MLNKRYKFPIEHEEAKQEKYRENMEELEHEITTEIQNDLKKKLRNESELFGVPYEYLVNLLKFEGPYSDILLSKYCKKPDKQNLNENLMRDFIGDLPIISNVKKYSTGGKDALYIVGGLVSSQRGTSDNTKSIDSSFEYIFEENRLEFYATLKYTKGKGGAQDNQANDVKRFLKAACDVRTPNQRFIAIVDGDYYTSTYTDPTNKVKYEHKMDFYEEENRKDTVKITNTDELLWRIVDFIINWLNELNSKGIMEKDKIEKEVERIIQIRNDYYI